MVRDSYGNILWSVHGILGEIRVTTTLSMNLSSTSSLLLYLVLESKNGDTSKHIIQVK